MGHNPLSKLNLDRQTLEIYSFLRGWEWELWLRSSCSFPIAVLHVTIDRESHSFQPNLLKLLNLDGEPWLPLMKATGQGYVSFELCESLQHGSRIWWLFSPHRRIKWGLLHGSMRTLLGNPALKPCKKHILAAKASFLEFLRIRVSSPLFRLPTANAIQVPRGYLAWFQPAHFKVHVTGIALKSIVI